MVRLDQPVQKRTHCKVDLDIPLRKTKNEVFCCNKKLQKDAKVAPLSSIGSSDKLSELPLV